MLPFKVTSVFLNASHNIEIFFFYNFRHREVSTSLVMKWSRTVTIMLNYTYSRLLKLTLPLYVFVNRIKDKEGK